MESDEAARAPWHARGVAAHQLTVRQPTTKSLPRPKRPPVPIATQAAVYFRAKWLCTLCGAPTVFPYALKALERFAGARFPERRLAYFNAHWRRDRAPLLDHLATCTDQVHAFSTGGAHDPSHFALACARCNQRKGDLTTAAFIRRYPRPVVKGQHGEPTSWDGLSSGFLAFGHAAPDELTATERKWVQALEAEFEAAAG